MTRGKTPRELIQDAFAAWEGGDSTAVTRLMADDVEWTIIGSTEISGTYRSRRDFLDVVNGKLLPRLTSPLQPTLHNLLADGDTVAAQFSSRATTTGDVDYLQTYCWVMTIEDERIRRGTAYLDTALIDRLLALPPGDE